MIDILSIFGTLAAFFAGVVTVTELFKKLFNITNERYQQWLSWGVSIVLAIVGLVCQFGFFADYGTVNDWTAWVLTVLTGFFAGLGSNGVFDIQTVHKFIKFIEELLKREPKEKYTYVK